MYTLSTGNTIGCQKHSYASCSETYCIPTGNWMLCGIHNSKPILDTFLYYVGALLAANWKQTKLKLKLK